jgi:hypothetical protein
MRKKVILSESTESVIGVRSAEVPLSERGSTSHHLGSRAQASSNFRPLDAEFNVKIQGLSVFGIDARGVCR